jgi:hypothetical protein
MKAAYLEHLHAERLEPGQETGQRSLIGQGAVQHGFDRLTVALSRSKSSRASGGRMPATRIS